MLNFNHVKPFQYLCRDNITEGSQDIIQCLTLANDRLRKEKRVKTIEQDRYWRKCGVIIGESRLSRWRNRSPYSISGNSYRFAAICSFWGLSFIEMLEIGEAEKKRLAELGK